MATSIDTNQWKPQQQRLWNTLSPKMQAEVAQQGPEKALAWVDKQLSRKFDMRGTIGAGKMTGRRDKLQLPESQGVQPKGDPGLLQDLKRLMSGPMSSPALAQSGVGEGGGGSIEARKAHNLDFIGMGPAPEGNAIPLKKDGFMGIKGAGDK